MSINANQNVTGTISVGKPLAQVEVSEIDGGHKITVTDPNGTQELTVLDGIGIESVEQITESDEDNGENVFRVTLENGESKDFTVKNGSKGNKGDKGEVGATGPQGEKGDTGAKGDKGDTGATGATGSIGATGPKGDKGDKGDTGPQGPQGETGPVGPQGPAGSGASSWNDLTDRPFGETTVTGDTLTWDGNTEGLTVVDGGDMGLWCKVSNAVVTDVSQGASGYMTEGGSATPVIFITSEYNGATMFLGGDVPFVMIIPTDNLDLDGTIFPTAGIYFMAGAVYISSLTINGYTGFDSVRTEITPLPNKYLDIIETVGGVDTLKWNGNVDGIIQVNDMYKVSELVPTIEELSNGGVINLIVQGQEASLPFNSFVEKDGSGILTDDESNDMVWIVTKDNAEYGEVVYPEKGIYFTYFPGLFEVTSLQINGYTGFTKEQVKQEYLPSGAVKYYSDTTYLYKDKDLTTKVTANELAKVKDTKTIVVGVIDGGEEFATATVILSAIFDGVGQVIVPFGIDAETLALQTMTVYTSEYTPTE